MSRELKRRRKRTWPINRHSRKAVSLPSYRLGVECLENRTLLATFIVNSPGDSQGDGDVDDDICDTGRNPSLSGVCTFRAAIQQAEQTVGKDTIQFSVPVVQLRVNLPSINDPVIIDGGPSRATLTTTRPIFPLNISAGDSIVRNLTMRGLGILLRSKGGNKIQGNYIGDTESLGGGTPNNGIDIDGSSNNIIGGTTPGERNVISGHQRGIRIRFGESNVIQGNYIGLNVTGERSIGNNQFGIYIETGSGNTIGGTADGAGNVISANGTGIEIRGSDNKVQGNMVGTDPRGPVRGNRIGVAVRGADNIIGGLEATAGNVISGNQFHGILIQGGAASGNRVQGNYIGTDNTGTMPWGNGNTGVFVVDASDNTIGGAQPGARNIISANQVNGIVIRFAGGILDAAKNNRVLGNHIGTDKAGKRNLGNGNGILIEESADNTIADNIIAANRNHGVEIVGEEASGNVLTHNFIGTDVTGMADGLGNLAHGLFINGAPKNIIGGDNLGPRLAAGNLISGNAGDGIHIQGQMASENLMQGNRIGTDVVGSSPLPNTGNGISIDNAPSNLIGLRERDDSRDALNLVSANGQNGIRISGVLSSDNIIRGALIGTDLSGTVIDTDGNPANGNDLGNARHGVLIQNAPKNRIEGVGTDLTNVISGNNEHGVAIIGTLASENVIRQTNIGSDINGKKALGNVIDGVMIDGGPNNFVGGNRLSSGNLIVANRRHGVSISGSPAAGNKIRGNQIGISDLRVPTIVHVFPIAAVPPTLVPM